jgi:asparagine synthetase B (glutamine-hydrolysing)
MKICLDKINCFLHYGYIPDPEVKLPDSIQLFIQGNLNGHNFVNLTGDDLIRTGAETLNQSFQDTLGPDHNKIHIIPLSGGLDSRTVLANLLDLVDRTKIITVTFGVSGSPDVEKARILAKKAGVKWEQVDLSALQWKWDTKMLIETAERSERPTGLFDSAINHAVQIRYGEDPVYWSGLMGDSLSRINPISRHLGTWGESRVSFAKRNSRNPNIKLVSEGFDPCKCLPGRPYIDKDKLDYYSQLNYCIRQQCLTKHIYSPLGYDIRYPFLNPRWVEFILNIPSINRMNQSLYRNIQKSYWPGLFNNLNSPYRDQSRLTTILQKKGRISLRHRIINRFPRAIEFLGYDKNTNYIDWNYAILRQKDFKDLIYFNLQDLKKRKIIDWIDFDNLWQTHQSMKKFLSSELMTLAAMELHFKAATILKDGVSVS